MSRTWRTFGVVSQTEPVWVCTECEDSYDTQEGALDCCSNRKHERAYECSECRKAYGDDFDATTCCEDKKATASKAWKCPKCGDLHASETSATTCCQTSLDAVSGYDGPEEVDEAWECSVCGSLRDTSDEAVECCGNKKRVDVWQCHRCESTYDDYTDAEHCCEDDKAREEDYYPCATCGAKYRVQADAEDCCEEVTEENPRGSRITWAGSTGRSISASSWTPGTKVELGEASHHDLSDMYIESKEAAVKAWRRKNVEIGWSSKKASAWANVVKGPRGAFLTVGVMTDEGDDLIMDAIPDTGLLFTDEMEIVEAVNKKIDDLALDVSLGGTHEATHHMIRAPDFDTVLNVAEELREEAEIASNDNFEALKVVVREVLDDFARERKRKQVKKPDAPPVPAEEEDEGVVVENPSAPRDVGEMWEDTGVEGGWYVQFPNFRQSFEKSLAEKWSLQLKKDLRKGALNLDQRIWTPDGINRRKLPPRMEMDDEGPSFENPKGRPSVSDMRRKRVAEGVRRAARSVAFEQGFGLHPFGDSIVVYAEPWNRWNLEALDLTFDEETEVIYEKIAQYVRDNTIPDLEGRGYKVLGWWQDHIGDGVAFGWTLVVASQEVRF